MAAEKKKAISPEISKWQKEINIYAIQFAQETDTEKKPQYYNKIMRIVLDTDGTYYKFLQNRLRSLSGNRKNDSQKRDVDNDLYDILCDTLKKSLDSYDPEKNDQFTAWLNLKLEYAMKDDERKLEKEKKRHVSANRPIGSDENAPTLEETLCDGEAPKVDAKFQVQELMLKIILGYAKYLEHHPSKKKDYMRLFFTGRVLQCLQDVPELGQGNHINTTLLYSVLNYTFLDFVLTSPCRTAPEIACAHRKIYAEITDQVKQPKAQKELYLPLEAIVYIAFLATQDIHVKNAAISQQQNKFNALISQILESKIPVSPQPSYR